MASVPNEVTIYRKGGTKCKGCGCYENVEYQVDGLKDTVNFGLGDKICDLCGKSNKKKGCCEKSSNPGCCGGCVKNLRLEPILRSDKKSGLEVIAYYSNYIEVWYFDQKIGVIEKSFRKGCCAGCNLGCCNSFLCCTVNWIYSFSANFSR